MSAPTASSSTSALATRYVMVIAIDDSEYAPIVLQHGLDLAGRRGLVDLHLISVRGDDGVDMDAAKARLAGQVGEELDAFRAVAEGWRVRLHVRTGRAAEEIAGLAGEVGAELIVIGRFGVQRTKRRLGSTAEQTLALAPCPTLVVQLVDREPDSAMACPACVELRAESEGERWFCADHAAPERVGMASTLLSSSLGWSTEGLTW